MMDIATILTLLLATASATGTSARPTVPLDGEWELVVQDKAQPYKILVPGSWQAQISELRDFVGCATYIREVSIPESWRGRRVFLCFGAVDYLADVYVNDRKIGSHEGGYTPFEFEITHAVKFGESNKIAVGVVDAGKERPVEGLKFEEIPHGKQSWYGNTSGIWQSTYLEARADCHIAGIFIDPDIDGHTARIRIELDRPSRGTLRLSFTSPPGADPVHPVTIDVAEKEHMVEYVARIPRAKLWSPGSPALYTVRAELVRDGKLLDSMSARFGMRKIEARDGQILLNNEPIFLAGTLDQDFYPLTEYSIPSTEYLRDQFLKAKHLGLNLLRCHIKVPDPRYLDMADELGLLVWYEIPNWIHLTEATKLRARQTLEQMLRRDHNHPSLVIISIINESWGINMADEGHRQWLAEMYDYAKSLDPSRLVVDNSACSGNFHVKTDIEDFHAYFQIPDQARAYTSWLADFSRRPSWTFGGGAKRRGFEPLVLSEFGNWGLPRLSNLARVYGREDPWWFGTGRSPSLEATSPAGVQDRFKEYHLDRIFGTIDSLADALQDQEWLALKYQIEELRKRESIVGYVITEFTDLHWESNGLLDYCRNPKTFHNLMHTIQGQDVVIATPKKFNFVAGEDMEFELWVSHFSSTDMSQYKIVCQSDYPRERKTFPVPYMKRGTAAKIGALRCKAPQTKQPIRGRVDIRLVDSSDKVLTSNYAEYAIFPDADPPPSPEVILTNRLDEDVIAKIRSGAHAIVCIESATDAPEFASGLKVVDRGESGTWGAWCNSVIWFRTQSYAFASTAVPKTMDFSFENLIPSCIITGVQPTYWENDVLSGIFIGWIHSNAAIALQLRCGNGRAILTTLPLSRASKTDPMAKFLTASLAEYLCSNHCQPELKDNLEIRKNKTEGENR
ncbi:MAG: glycoside hydrolase family 2 protein [Armatimonadota bacterium]